MNGAVPVHSRRAITPNPLGGFERRPTAAVNRIGTHREIFFAATRILRGFRRFSALVGTNLLLSRAFVNLDRPLATKRRI